MYATDGQKQQQYTCDAIKLQCCGKIKSVGQHSTTVS